LTADGSEVVSRVSFDPLFPDVIGPLGPLPSSPFLPPAEFTPTDAVRTDVAELVALRENGLATTAVLVSQLADESSSHESSSHDTESVAAATFTLLTRLVGRADQDAEVQEGELSIAAAEYELPGTGGTDRLVNHLMNLDEFLLDNVRRSR